VKRLALFLVIVLTIALSVGCNKTAVSDVKNQSEDEVVNQVNTETKIETADFEKYKGIWKLKVAGDEEIYLMTSLEEYFGSTGIDIAEINNGEVKGSIYSVGGAPSYRQAEVAFAGKIEDGKLKASYKDEGWEYTGNIELNFGNGMIVADITRNKVETYPMWGIPEGKFKFIKPINTEKGNISDQEKKTLQKFLMPTAKDRIKQFGEGSLTDEMIINFVGYNLALGLLDTSEFGDKLKENADIVFDESVIDDVAKKYFGVEVKQHKTFDITKYKDGKYTLPALGGVSEYPRVQVLLKDTNNEGVYYAIVDYMMEYPEEGEKLEYQRLFKLQKNNAYTIKAIKEIEDPINL